MNVFCWVLTLLIITSVISHYKFIHTSNITNNRKILAMMIVVSHDVLSSCIIGLILFIAYGFLAKRKDVHTYLMVLNIIVCLLIISYISCQMCLMTLIYNRLLGIDKCTGYILFTDTPYIGTSHKNNKCSDNERHWLKWGMIIFLFTALLNIIYFLSRHSC